MSLFKGKIAQRSAMAISAAALVGAMALPTTVFGQSVTLNRCPANGTGGPSPFSHQSDFGLLRGLCRMMLFAAPRIALVLR